MAKAVDKALSPDNIDLPQGMSISQKQQGERIVLFVSLAPSSRSDIETLISTLDEFVSHIQGVTDTIGEIERRKERIVRDDRPKDTKRKSRISEGKSPKAKHA